MSIKLPEGVALIHLEEVGSTMSEAAMRASSLTGPTWVLADRQTAAHGRRGRKWLAQDGNLSATLLMRPECAPRDAALRSFVAALALYDALASLTDEPLSLKWPNDVLLNGRKVAGILLESSSKGLVVDWLSVGIGVNLASAPDARDIEDGAIAPVALADLGVMVSNTAFLELLAAAFDHWEGILQREGFGPVRTAWLERAARLGEQITAKTSTNSQTGIFETVDDAGNLILQTASGPSVISAADVYF